MSDVSKRDRFHSALINPQIVFFYADCNPVFQISLVSQNIHSILGYRAEDFSKGTHSLTNCIHPNDVESFNEAISDLVNHNKRHITEEIRVRNYDGDYVWFNLTMEVEDAIKQQPKITGMFFSIDKWKKEFLVMHAKINDAEIKNSILCLACESTNVNMLLNAILVPIIRLLEFDGAGFYQIDHKARQAKLVAYSGFDENFIAQVSEVCIDHYPYHKVLLDGEVVITDDYENYTEKLARQFSIQSFVFLPIYVNSRIWGSLNIASHLNSGLTDRHLAQLADICKLIGRIIDGFEYKTMLNKSMQDYETFFQTIEDFVFVLDEQGQIIHANQTAIERLKYSLEEMKKMNVIELHPPEDRKIAAQTVSDMLAGKCTCCPISLVTKDKQEIPVETKVVLGAWNARQVLLGISRDVSVQRKAEQERELSESRYRSVVEDQTELICRFLADGTILFVNNAYCRYFSKSKDELEGKSFFPLMPAEDAQIVADNFGKLSENNPFVIYQHRVYLSDGTIRWNEWTDRAICDKDGKIIEYQAVGRDITLLKSAENAQLQYKREVDDLLSLRSKQLIESESRYHVFFESLLDPVLILNEDTGQVLEANQAALNYWKDSYCQLTGRYLFDLTNLTYDQFNEMKQHIFSLPPRRCEYQCHSSHEHPKVLKIVTGSTHLLEQLCVICVIHDISQNVEDERKIRESKLQLEAIINSLPDATWVIDLNRRVIAWNNQMTDLTGKTFETVIGLDMYEAFDFAVDSPYFVAIRSLLEGKLIEKTEQIDVIFRQDSSIIIEVQMHYATGSYGYYWISATMLHDASNQVIGALETIRNVTEQKRLARQNSLTQKLESIGLLAAGIAHEINTPLQYIGDNINFLKQSFELLVSNTSEYFKCNKNQASTFDYDYYLHEIPAALSESLIGIERVTKLMSAMKSFCHPNTGKFEKTDINQAIKDVITISRNTWKYITFIGLRLDPNHPIILCDIDQITQVIINMLINSTDAIEENKKRGNIPFGQINISTAITHDHYFEICIQDNGIGIPHKYLDKVFDPFFTTKDVGKGTGQGLAIAQDVVRSHGGKIFVESTPNKETQFRILLPYEMN